jgi:hypothetical protein
MGTFRAEPTSGKVSRQQNALKIRPVMPQNRDLPPVLDGAQNGSQCQERRVRKKKGFVRALRVAGLSSHRELFGRRDPGTGYTGGSVGQDRLHSGSSLLHERFVLPCGNKWGTEGARTFPPEVYELHSAFSSYRWAALAAAGFFGRVSFPDTALVSNSTPYGRLPGKCSHSRRPRKS